MKVLIEEFPYEPVYKDFNKTHYYCPGCGKKGLWVNWQEYGPQGYTCSSCGSCLYISEPELADLRVLKQLKTGRTKRKAAKKK